MIRCDTLRLALFSDTYPPQVNGVARTLERLAAAVTERGGVVQVFTVQDPDAAGAAAGDVSTNEVSASEGPAGPTPRIVRFPSVPFWAYDQLRLAWPAQRAVRRELTAFRPTLVHAATEFGVGIAARRAARALHVPFVSSYHTSFTEYARYYHLGVLARPGWHYLRWFHNGGLRTYCPTRAIVDEVTAHGFINTKVWSRGVDPVRFNPRYRSEPLREQIGASPDTLVVAYVGRLAAEKGLGVALDALRLADRERPGRIRFACVGDGPYEAEIRRRAPAGSWIPGKLLGAALSEAYATADLFLFPSTTDTFGNVMLEAMASGLPVLGADVGPTRELLGADRGWIVSAADASAYAAVLVSLVDDRRRLILARAQALAFAESSTWERVWDALLADYLELHAGRELRHGALEQRTG
jgi:phosphatidylinositol alpha 1,6-mannosyltransferase